MSQFFPKWSPKTFPKSRPRKDFVIFPKVNRATAVRFLEAFCRLLDLSRQKVQTWYEAHTPLTILLSLFAIYVCTWMVSRHFVGESWGLVRVGNYLAIWISIAMFLSLLIAVWLRRRWQIAALFVLFSLTVYQNQLLAWATPVVTSASPENQLRIMTFNAHPTNQQMDELAALILDSDLDVIALQEISDAATVALMDTLADEYPYAALDHQLALLSRYPIRPLHVPSVMMESQLAIISLPENDVYVWNVHAPTGLQKRIWKEQTRDLRIVARHLTRTNDPVLLLGDLNTTAHNENYQLIANHLTDTHTAAGKGLGLTYPAPDVVYTEVPSLSNHLEWLPTLFRIDYIFASDHWQVMDANVVEDGYGSDHLPIVATVALKQAAK